MKYLSLVFVLILATSCMNKQEYSATERAIIELYRDPNIVEVNTVRRDGTIMGISKPDSCFEDPIELLKVTATKSDSSTLK